MMQKGKFRILFVCHGNICRSTMAHYVMLHLVREAGRERDFVIDSAACTRDALGMGAHSGTRKVLAKRGIYCGDHRARLLRRSDADAFDYIIGMDQENLADMRRILGGAFKDKASLLLDWTHEYRDVADPWYTDDFETTFDDVWRGCTALLGQLT